jgi:hypothetical protein
MNSLFVLLAVAVSVLLVFARTIRITPQTHAGASEQLGRHERGAPAWLIR